MQALQAQIKPHFLYNTLDIIKWMVLGGYYTDSVETINELSQYLRMSISKTTNIVILRDEIELGKAYVKIIQKRFPSKFGFEIDADPDTLDCLLPKFVLQPILENSLTHGLLYCDKSDLLLTIRAWISDGMLNIQIEDNGMGMTAETLQLLKSGSIESKEGYGLKNTRQRLVLFNGSDTEFNVESVESRFGVGTCVTLGLKAARAERRK